MLLLLLSTGHRHHHHHHHHHHLLLRQPSPESLDFGFDIAASIMGPYDKDTPAILKEWKPNLVANGWGQIVDKEHVKLFSKKMSTDTTPEPYMWNLAVGFYPGVDASHVFKVFEDTEYRMEWDDYTLEVEMVAESNGTQIVRHESKFPFPFKNRDYLFAR
jgi:hypothetical protein